MFNVQCPSLLQLPVAVAAAIRAALVVATLGDVLLTRCSGSRLRVNLQQFNEGFWENVTTMSNIEMPTIKKNHLTLLYENLDNIWARRAKKR